MTVRTMNRSRSVFWSLDDEAAGRQYEVRITYEIDAWDEGDFTTPPVGGQAVLRHVEVLQARHFDADGNLSGVDLGAAARRYDQRAWELIDEGVVSQILG